MKNTAALFADAPCEECNRLRVKLANKKAAQVLSGSYRVPKGVIRDMAQIHKEIPRDVDYAMRLLDSLLEELDPGWRDL